MSVLAFISTNKYRAVIKLHSLLGLPNINMLQIHINKTVQVSLGREMAHIMSYTLKGLYVLSEAHCYTLKAQLSKGRKFKLKQKYITGDTNNLNVLLKSYF